MSDTKQLEALRDEQASGVGAATTIWPTDDPRIDVMTAQLAAIDRAIARLRAEQPQEQPKPIAVCGAIDGVPLTHSALPPREQPQPTRREVLAELEQREVADAQRAGQTCMEHTGDPADPGLMSGLSRDGCRRSHPHEDMDPACRRFADYETRLAEMRAQLAAAQREPDARWVLDDSLELEPEISTSEFNNELSRLLAGRERVTLRVYAEEEQP